MSAARVLRIGTRGSRLALWQAHAVAARLQSAGFSTEIVPIKTTGDRSQTQRVPGDDTKRQFVKEIEDALSRGDVDVAVHSAKDLPADLPEGLQVRACLPREDPRDALVLPRGQEARDWRGVIAHLTSTGRDAGPTIGTGSVRRIAQLKPSMPAAVFTPIRGNVDTRLNKLDAGGFDALVLACAGLSRLGFADRISCPIPLEQCVPAPGQGIVAAESRTTDHEVRELLESLRDEEAEAALEAERTLIAVLGGGCQLPLGALALHDGTELELHASVASTDGARSIRRVMRGSAANPDALGRLVAEQLLHAGARALLDEAH